MISGLIMVLTIGFSHLARLAIERPLLRILSFCGRSRHAARPLRG
ncbi:MAG: hypothetical protein ABIT04_04230 [Novosphingobium sp.]